MQVQPAPYARATVHADEAKFSLVMAGRQIWCQGNKPATDEIEELAAHAFWLGGLGHGDLRHGLGGRQLRHACTE